jgi:hypothetical protein
MFPLEAEVDIGAEVGDRESKKRLHPDWAHMKNISAMLTNSSLQTLSGARVQEFDLDSIETHWHKLFKMRGFLFLFDIYMTPASFSICLPIELIGQQTIPELLMRNVGI